MQIYRKLQCRSMEWRICVGVVVGFLLCYVVIGHFSLTLARPKDLPILLFWTTQIYPHEDTDELSLIQCGKSNCYVTNKRQYLDDPNTRGIMFYGSGVDPEDLPLPRTRNHEWCLFHEESPLNNYILSHDSFISLFNHTATFKRESDYPLTTQDIFSLEYLVERKPVDLKIKNKMRKEGFAALMYAQSHDNVPSFRDMYVKELMKYIDIDSYGTCLHNKDLPRKLQEASKSFQDDDFLNLIANYKFHLSFENAVCNDYMTEKLMRPLHLGSVPIYYGSPRARDWMPANNTIIMVNDFKTPKELAEFIKYLDENDDEYLKYLSFKNSNGITNNFLKDTVLNREWGTHDYKYYYYNTEDKMDYYHGFECHICKDIHNRMQNENNASEQKNIGKMANNTHLGCPKPFPPLLDQNLLNDHTVLSFVDHMEHILHFVGEFEVYVFRPNINKTVHLCVLQLISNHIYCTSLCFAFNK